MAGSISSEDINWHSDPFSFAKPQRSYTADELWTLTCAEEAIEQLPQAQIAGWIVDLIGEVARLRVALHASMDALHGPRHGR